MGSGTDNVGTYYGSGDMHRFLRDMLDDAIDAIDFCDEETARLAIRRAKAVRNAEQTRQRLREFEEEKDNVLEGSPPKGG